MKYRSEFVSRRYTTRLFSMTMLVSLKTMALESLTHLFCLLSSHLHTGCDAAEEMIEVRNFFLIKRIYKYSY